MIDELRRQDPAIYNAIAREAGIAKPTLYAQFADKDAIFSAMVDMLLEELEAAYDQGMASEGSLAERIGAALAGQYAVLARRLEDSPHAAELMNEHRRVAPRMHDKDMRTETELVETLRSAGAKEPELLARLVTHAAYGIAFKSRNEAETSRAIRLMCERVVGPEVRQ